MNMEKIIFTKKRQRKNKKKGWQKKQIPSSHH